MMIVHVQDLDITHSAESLTHQEHDAIFLDTSAGKGQGFSVLHTLLNLKY